MLDGPLLESWFDGFLSFPKYPKPYNKACYIDPQPQVEELSSGVSGVQSSGFRVTGGVVLH